MKMVWVRFPVFLLILVLTAAAIPPLSIQTVEDGYRIQLEVPDPLLQKEQVTTVTSDGVPVDEPFVKAFIYGFDYDGALGAPALLSGSFNLAYEGEEPVVEVENVVTRKIPLDGKLYPVQPPRFYDGSSEVPPFAYNPESYQWVAWGDPLSVSDTFTYRGQKGVEISVRPLSYDPETNTATVIKNMSLTVTMKKPQAVRSNNSREFDKVMRALFPNLEGVPSEKFYAREKYLIIADSVYCNNADLKRFIDYRSSQYDVKLVSTADVGGTTKEAYRNLIFKKENPTFCLLVGSSFPAWETCSWNSLNYYVASQVTSSGQKPRPSIALGLFWVTSAAQITNIVNKTIATESSPAPRTRIVLGQGGNTEIMGNLPANHCDETVKEVNTKYFTPDNGFQVFNYASTPGGTRAVDRFNLGCWFNIYNGHGSLYGQALGWGISNLSSMHNTIYPFVLTCACHTGTFNQNCVAAAAVGNEHGPVTYIGANNNSSIGQHVLNQGYPEAIMVRKITKNGLAFVYGVNYDSTPRAISEYAGEVSTGIKAMMGWQYHHFGDPAIETMPSVLEPPFIEVSVPTRGDLWEQGTPQKILWNENNSGMVRIDLYKGNELYSNITSWTENDGIYDWTVPTTLPAGTDYQIRLTGVDSAALRLTGDDNTELWDTSATFSITSEYLITPPYYQSFDSLDSGSAIMPPKYGQLSADEIDWLVWKGPTPSRIGDSPDTTGPMNDHTTGSGNYIYVEASGPNNPGKKADFVTPNFNLRAPGLKLSFWIHMMSLSNNMGNLVLDICVDGTWRTDVLTITGNQGTEWQQRVVDLAPYAGDRVSFKFRATTGASWASDIGIDDLSIEGSVNADANSPTNGSFQGLAIRGNKVLFAVPGGAAAHPCEISIYNSQGRLVKTIVKGRISSGTHVLPIGSLGAGLYVVKLKGKGFVQSTNMLYTR